MFKGQLLKKMMVLGVPFVLFFSSCMKETFVYGEGDGFKFKASADALNDVERLTKGGDSQLIYANGGDSLFLSSEAELNFVDAFTKAAPTANLTEKIGVFGYKYTGSAPTGNADLANDVELSKESNEFWKPAMNLAWPGADKVQFFGYYPKGYSAVSVKSVANGTPVLNFTVPANVADQKELLVAKTGEYSGDAEQIVAMPFRHALTAIQFSAGDDLKPGITIKKISVKGVASKGEVKLSDVTWSNQNTNADYTIDNINFVSAVGGNKTITSGDKTLMLLPQTVPAGATIEVVMNDEHGDHILKAAVDGQSWNAGDRITYRISSKAITWTYTFDASVTGTAVAHTGGDQAYKVKSFRTNGNGVKQFVPYTIEYSVDGSNWTMERPAFLTKIEGKQTGTTEETALTATFAAQEKTLQTSDIILKARPVLSNVDLSTVDVKGNAHGKGTTTANCYVIHNPGTYKFPTVYGNSRKNGQDNTSAYTSTKNGSNILSPFLGAHGPITKPQIDNINNACLIWQDTKDLISEIKYENNYVSFAVKKETIHNGNAIIAVRDASNTILWSWHIWVTERDLSSVEVTNFQNVTYKFLPVNLGWCGFGNEWYAPREVKTRLKQAGGKSVELSFKSNGEVLNNDYDIKNGNNPYYQWGRKDPMLPGNGITQGIGKDKTCFTTDANYKFKYGSEGLNTNDIKEYIRNPHKFNIKEEMDGKYLNLWSTDNARTDANDDKVIKSVYDPSPVGYSLPASNAFTGFTTTGGNVGTKNTAPLTPEQKALCNTKGNYDKGWLFYGKPDKQGVIVFFPASGYRYHRSGSLSDETTAGFYWVAGPTGTHYGHYLNFFSSSVNPLDSSYRGYGFAVRSAEEK